MDLRSFTLPLLALLTIAGAGSCRKPDVSSDIATNGLVANKTYRCDAAGYDKPTRMFTAAGEVTDPSVIAAYQQLKPWFHDTAIASRSTPLVFTSQTDRIYYNGWIPYKAIPGSNGAMHLSQLDTSVREESINDGNIDVLFKEEASFFRMRDEALDLRQSMTLLDRLDEKSYRIRERFQTQASFKDGVLRLPFTFIASRYFLEDYPFATKSGSMPKVPEGDTLIVREGYVDLR